METTYDLAIIGGGPAGSAAGVYASRKRLKTIFITDVWGGQSVVSPEIQNWIGTIAISGENFAKQLKAHLEFYAGDVVDIVGDDKVKHIVKDKDNFLITTGLGKNYSAKTILIATGASRRRLAIQGADTFEHKGLTYCASCDGPLFAGMDVVVIGGGNAGFETAAQLLAYAKSVTLLNRSNTFKADPITSEKVLKDPKMRAIKNIAIKEIKGEAFVSGIIYTDKETGEEHELKVQGIFVEIGLIPSTDFTEGFLELDAVKRIVVNPKNQKTSVAGIWAAGDCTDELYHQNNIAAGDAVKAIEDIYVHLKAK